MNGRPRLRMRLLFGITVAVAYGVYLPLYTWINNASSGTPEIALFLPGEEAIPLVPGFAILYALGFVLPLLVIWAAPDWGRFRRALLAFVLVVSTAFLTFLLFPVAFERPPSSLRQAGLLRLAYWDGPSNCLPSLHVAIAWLVYFACRRTVRYPKLLFATVMGISLSTVLVKQHYLVDVIAGFGLSAAAWLSSGAIQRFFHARQDPERLSSGNDRRRRQNDLRADPIPADPGHRSFRDLPLSGPCVRRTFGRQGKAHRTPEVRQDLPTPIATA